MDEIASQFFSLMYQVVTGVGAVIGFVVAPGLCYWILLDNGKKKE